jgi:hypothetical protein
MSSQAVLLKEYKALSKEKWVHIEVSGCSAKDREGEQRLTDPITDQRRECPRVESCSDRHQPGLALLWRLFQSPDDISLRVSLQASGYATTIEDQVIPADQI